MHASENFNLRLGILGYTPITEAAYADLILVHQEEIERWLDHCVAGTAPVEIQSSLRGALMAVSDTMLPAFEDLGVRLLRTDRIRLVMKNTKAWLGLVQAIRKQNLPTATSDQAIRAAQDLLQQSGNYDKRPTIAGKVHHVYGTTAAIAFELSTTPKHRPCLHVDAAAKSVNSKGFDWGQKISIQLVDEEILRLIACLKGWIPRFEAAHHGPQKDKRFTMQNNARQPGFLASVRKGSSARVVPVTPFASLRVLDHALKVCKTDAPHLSTDEFYAAARQFSSAHSSGPA
jgi:hypothetical protein